MRHPLYTRTIARCVSLRGYLGQSSCIERVLCITSWFLRVMVSVIYVQGHINHVRETRQGRTFDLAYFEPCLYEIEGVSEYKKM